VEPFGARLWQAMNERGRLCVGIDPHPQLLREWGLSDDAAGLERFALAVVDTLGSQVAVFKPQSAFFERHGSAGIAVLEATIAAARSAGALVVLDVKRGDIGSTAKAYAEAYLDPASSLASDAVTANPFLGVGALDPIIDAALEHGAGVFVLALTSNPEGRSLQQARVASGATVTGEILSAVAARNADTTSLGSIGAVVGATIGSTAEDLEVNGPLLVPGVGAQGGTLADLPRIFGGTLRNVLPSLSRELLSAGPRPAALLQAAHQALDATDHLLGRPQVPPDARGGLRRSQAAGFAESRGPDQA
jgi:orotidine-5'-phosphate decarboxylase